MTVYLIHLARPYHHARHYLGYTSNLTNRLAQHRSGTGAKLLKAVRKAGISFEVVRTWEGYATLEKQLKARKNAPKLCPVCIQQRITRAMQLQQPRRAEPSLSELWPEVNA